MAFICMHTCTYLHVTVSLCCTVGMIVQVLTECCPALAPPQQRRKAQSDCGGAAVEPWAAQPHIALCRCRPRCVLLMPRWAGGGNEREKCTFLYVLANVVPPSYGNVNHRPTFTSGDLSSRLQSGV